MEIAVAAAEIVAAAVIITDINLILLTSIERDPTLCPFCFFDDRCGGIYFSLMTGFKRQVN